MTAPILTREQQEAEALAWDSELRRQEEMGRKLLEAREREVRTEPEYAI